MLIEIHGTTLQADRLRGSPGFIFLRPPSECSRFTFTERCERERAIYAGWPDCSAEWLNPDWRFLDAKQMEN